MNKIPNPNPLIEERLSLKESFLLVFVILPLVLILALFDKIFPDDRYGGRYD